MKNNKKIALRQTQGNPEQSRRIGCLGMSANPPHIGHFQMAKEILRLKLVDEIWLIPCFKHAFDKKLISWEHRWNMTKLMKSKKIRACDIELQRKGKSYTINTVRELKAKFPDFKFYWIIGADIIKSQEYKKWKDWKKLIKEIEFLVVPREGFEVKKNELPPNFQLVNIKPIKNISSTEIREKIKRRESLGRLIPKRVKDYIIGHHFYSA